MIRKVAAVGSVAVALASLVVAAVLDAAVTGAQRAAVQSEPGWYAGVSGLALAVPGALLLWRMPRHPVAWVLCLTGVHWAVDGVAGSYLTYATLREPALPGASLSFWLYQRLGGALLLSLPLVLLLYPDGRLPAGRWRVVSYLSLVATALLPLALLAVPSSVADAASGIEQPAQFAGLNVDPTTIPLTEGVWSALMSIAYVLVPVGLLVPVGVVFGRYRTAGGVRRVQLRWLLWAALVDLLVMVSMIALPKALTSIGLLIAVTLTGFAVAVGIVRPYLLDIDRLLGGTLLYAALAATVVLVDLAVVGMADAVLGERLDQRDAALAALLLVLTVYGPLRHRLWLLIRRVALGRRDDRYGVIAGLAEQLERTDSPEDQLLATAQAVAEAFRIRYVAVEVERTGGGRLLAEHGERPDKVRLLPITYRGDQVGRLVLPEGGPRGASRSRRDARLLADVVRQAAAAARTGYLAEELQHSRERIVAAREEERRRLRRDLHDGLGPSLGGVALRIETARNLARAGRAEQADGVLKRARDDMADALAEVRRLVHDLRPPALDDVGLLDAVRQQAERLRTPGLNVRVDGGPGLDALPAAIEVAAYRIASEALANVARHARASTCTVRLTIDDGALSVEIRDDGVGIPAGRLAGVGLISLRERAAELGGRCEIGCPEGGGTRILAVLPLATPPADAPAGTAAREGRDG